MEDQDSASHVLCGHLASDPVDENSFSLPLKSNQVFRKLSEVSYDQTVKIGALIFNSMKLHCKGIWGQFSPP